METHTKRVLQAALLAPLIIIPGVFVPSLSMGLYQDLFGSAYHSSTIIAGAAVLVFAASLVAYLGSLFYGLPVYLVLKRLDRINLPYLLIAAIIPFAVIALIERSWYSFFFFSAFSVPVAVSFWLIVAPLSAYAERMRNRLTVSIVVLTLGLFAFYIVSETVFATELRHARLHRALVDKAPKPAWWEQTRSTLAPVTSVDQARQLYQSKVECCRQTETSLATQQEFFKLAYEAIWQQPDNAALVIELVHKIALLDLAYPHVFGLQSYAMSLATREQADPNTIAAVLVSMFMTAGTERNNLELVRTYSMTLLAAHHRRLHVAQLAPLCDALFAPGINQRLTHYETNTLRYCLRGLQQGTDSDAHEIIRRLQDLQSPDDGR